MNWSRFRNPVAVTLFTTLVSYACDTYASVRFPETPPADEILVAVKVFAWALVVAYVIMSMASKCLELEERWRRFRNRSRE